MRKTSLQRLNIKSPQNILINGIGTGLDIPHLPTHHQYTATDITPAMLTRCQARLNDSPIDMKLHIADAMKLPFADHSFDAVLMNLILAVVPEPLSALQEAARVIKPGGKIYILDKFIGRYQLAPTRRILNIFMRHIATRTDVVFENLLDECPNLVLLNDQPSMAGGWFRLIDLEKRN